MKYILLIMLMLLSACYRVEEPYLEYVTRFEKEYRPVYVSVIGDRYMSNKYLAICYRNATNYIHVNAKKWPGLTDVQKEIVIFHEMGHCALGIKEHVNTKSIMNSKAPELLDDYEENRDEYIEELLGE